MSQSNYPSGFPGFQLSIETLTESLGGTEAVRAVVEEEFADRLRVQMNRRLYGSEWSSSQRYSAIWTAATDLDFAAATEDALNHFQAHHIQVVREWESPTLNGKIVLRDRFLYLEREHVENAIMVAHGWADTYARDRIHPAQEKRRDPWHIGLSNYGEKIAKVLDRRPQMAATTAQGLVGARKTLVRFAETVFV